MAFRSVVIQMRTRDLDVYGTFLEEQREADLAGTEPEFMASCRA